MTNPLPESSLSVLPGHLAEAPPGDLHDDPGICGIDAPDKLGRNAVRIHHLLIGSAPVGPRQFSTEPESMNDTRHAVEQPRAQLPIVFRILELLAFPIALCAIASVHPGADTFLLELRVNDFIAMLFKVAALAFEYFYLDLIFLHCCFPHVMEQPSYPAPFMSRAR